MADEDTNPMTPSPARRGVLTARPNAEPKEAVPETGVRPLGLGLDRDGVLLVPERYRPDRAAPLLLLLHGAGGRGEALLPLFSAEAEARGIVVAAPDSRAGTWDVIHGGYGADVAFIDRMLARIFARQAIDSDRIAVAGFSDGASYALSLGLINGLLFSDILAFSPGFMAPTEQADAPRVFMSHGTGDRVLPINVCSRRLASTLNRAGYDLDYREFDGGHVVPADMIAAALDRFLEER